MITVKITAEDIKRGRKISPQWCPVAIAVRRKTRKRTRVYGGAEVFIAGCRYEMDDAHYSFPQDFDKGLKVEPCTIKLKKYYRFAK